MSLLCAIHKLLPTKMSVQRLLSPGISQISVCDHSSYTQVFGFSVSFLETGSISGGATQLTSLQSLLQGEMNCSLLSLMVSPINCRSLVTFLNSAVYSIRTSFLCLLYWSVHVTTTITSQSITKMTLSAVQSLQNFEISFVFFQRSIGLPDVHSGYGFAIGNMAAFDMNDPEAVVSPGKITSRLT